MGRQWLERILSREGGASPRGSELLVWFMRIVSTLWLAKGLMHWSMVLGMADQPGRRFAEMPMSAQAATVFFSVVDVVAAVGLWMVSAWGGVVWILAACAHAALDLLAPQIFGRQLSFVVAVVALIGVYALLTFLAAREAHQTASPPV